MGNVLTYLGRLQLGVIVWDILDGRHRVETSAGPLDDSVEPAVSHNQEPLPGRRSDEMEQWCGD